MTARRPWGDGPAPAHHCHECRRRIGRTTHFVIADRFILCTRCAVTNGRRNHSKYYPECDQNWHDLQDHGSHFATGAAAWYLLIEGETL